MTVQNGFQRRKERKKRHILQAALDLFMTNGTKKVTISEIAQVAQVSQVTIYNYFGDKDRLIRDVIIFYIDNVWGAYEVLLDSDASFTDKVKQMIFAKKEESIRISDAFYQDIMTEYAEGLSYIEKFYTEKMMPRLMAFFNEAKENGDIDPTISNEAIMFYFQMMKDQIQRKDIYETALPLTEDITKLLFYGIVGNNQNKE